MRIRLVPAGINQSPTHGATNVKSSHIDSHVSAVRTSFGYLNSVLSHCMRAWKLNVHPVPLTPTTKSLGLVDVYAGPVSPRARAGARIWGAAVRRSQ